MRNRPRNMRRRMRLRLLLAGAVLPLALWAALPVFSEGASSPSSRLHDLQHKIETTQGKIGRRKGTERVLTTQISAYSQRIGRLQGRIGTPAEPAVQRAGRPRRQAQRAVRHPARPARRAPPAGAPARPPGPGPRGARAAARRALPGRQARHRHRDPVLQGLRRAARARRVHAARVRAGPADHQARARRQGRRDGHRRAPGQARGPPAAHHRDRPAAPRRDRRAPSRASSTRKVGLDGTRADKARALGTVRAERKQLEGNLSGLKAEQSKIQATLQQAAGQPARRADQARQRQPDLAGQRPDHLAVLRAPRLGGLPPGHRHRRPRGHADPRRRRAAAWP